MESGNPVRYSDPTGRAQDGGNYGPGYGLAAMGYGYYGYGTHGVSYESWNGIMLYYGGGQLIGTGTLSGSYATAFNAGGVYAGGVRGDAVRSMLLGSQQVSGNLGVHEGAVAKADSITDSLMDSGYGRIPEPSPPYMLYVRVMNFFSRHSAKLTAWLGGGGNRIAMKLYSIRYADYLSQFTMSNHFIKRFLTRSNITMDQVNMALIKGAQYFDRKNGTISYVLNNAYTGGKDLIVAVNIIDKLIRTVIMGNGAFHANAQLPNGVFRYIFMK